MQNALRPYVSASVAMIGASLIAITPVVVTPDTTQRAVQLASVDVLGDLEGMISTLGTKLSGVLDEDVQSVEAILAGLVDPDLTSTSVDSTAVTADVSQFTSDLAAADKAAASASGFLSEADGSVSKGDLATAMSDYGDAAKLSELAARSAASAETDMSNVVSALSSSSSSTDPIQVFDQDLTNLTTDLEGLLSGQSLSATFSDLLAALNAAPAALEEEIALLLDPAGTTSASGLAFDVSAAAAGASNAQQEYADASNSALDAYNGISAGDTADQILTNSSLAENDLVTAGVDSQTGETYATDLVNALGTLGTPDVSSELDTLGSTFLSQLDALGSLLSSDLQTLGADIMSLF